jgi:hypothetical protein
VLLFLYLIGFLVFGGWIWGVGGWIWGVAGGVGLILLITQNYHTDECTNKAPQKDPHVREKNSNNREQTRPDETLNPNWQCRFFESKDVRS